MCRNAHIAKRGCGSAIVTHRPTCPSAMPNHRAYGAACISAHPEARAADVISESAMGGGADVIWVYARGRWRSVGCVLGGQRRSFGCMLGGRWRSRGCALGGALEVMPVSVRGGRWRSVRSHARVCIATLLKRLQAIILSISACTCVYRKASKTSADKYSRHMEVHVCASQSF